jgi:hypothetical protein
MFFQRDDCRQRQSNFFLSYLETLCASRPPKLRRQKLPRTDRTWLIEWPGQGRRLRKQEPRSAAQTRAQPGRRARYCAFSSLTLRLRKVAMRVYSTLRCSGSDGSSRSWLISRVCSSTHSCQQSAHVALSTSGPHRPGNGACANPSLRSPHRWHATSLMPPS